MMKTPSPSRDKNVTCHTLLATGEGSEPRAAPPALPRVGHDHYYSTCEDWNKVRTNRLVPRVKGRVCLRLFHVEKADLALIEPAPIQSYLGAGMLKEKPTRRRPTHQDWRKYVVLTRATHTHTHTNTPFARRVERYQPE